MEGSRVDTAGSGARLGLLRANRQGDTLLHAFDGRQDIPPRFWGLCRRVAQRMTTSVTISAMTVKVSLSPICTLRNVTGDRILRAVWYQSNLRCRCWLLYADVQLM